MLSAIPIFLVWTYVSWVVVLVGAQVAAGHQNERLVRQRFRARLADQALRETLAVVAAAHVARDFISGEAPRSPAALAEVLRVPALAMEEILEALARAGLLAQTAAGREVRYLPARDLDTIRVGDVRGALRRDARAEGLRAEVERQLEPGLLRVLNAAEEESRRSPQNVTLRELAALVGRADAAAPAAAQSTGGSPVLDAK